MHSQVLVLSVLASWTCLVRVARSLVVLEGILQTILLISHARLIQSLTTLQAVGRPLEAIVGCHNGITGCSLHASLLIICFLVIATILRISRL